MDILARSMADYFWQVFKQWFLVDNRFVTGGNLGVPEMAKGFVLAAEQKSEISAQTGEPSSFSHDWMKLDKRLRRT